MSSPDSSQRQFDVLYDSNAKVATLLLLIIGVGWVATSKDARVLDNRAHGLIGTAASRLIPSASAAPSGNDFTIAIVPDPQYLAESCPDVGGQYYASMMQWIVDNKYIQLRSGEEPFFANIKAAIGVGDCVNAAVDGEFKNAENAWRILDKNGIAFTTPPGNHDYTDFSNGITSRSSVGDQFKKGFFSAKSRSKVYGHGIDLGFGDRAFWIGSHDSAGANTAVKFMISGIGLLVLAMDFFAGNNAWSWAYDVMRAHPDCECYITTHAWLTAWGSQYRRTDGYGPDGYSMPGAPFSNAAAEAWNDIGVKTWPNLFGVFCGHDIFDPKRAAPSGVTTPAWFWQQVPIKSESSRRQTVQQIFVNSQELDHVCSKSASQGNGQGQIASVFLLSRRPARGVLEGRMISTRSTNWFKSKSPKHPEGTSWSDSETLLFSVPFTGLQGQSTSAATSRLSSCDGVV
jgi:hypothetical protein